MTDRPHLQVVDARTSQPPAASAPAAPAAVRVRRLQPLHGAEPDRPGQVLDVETARWGIYGDVVDAHIDEAGRPVVVVAPRRPGPAAALRGALSRRTTTHEAHVADQEHQP